MVLRLRLLVVFTVVSAGCVPAWIAKTHEARQADATTVGSGTLQNFLRPATKVFSGGEPKNGNDFASLADKGVRTIVSVDGIRPNLELAAEHNMEYVHIPIGYDGVDEHAQQSLVRLIKDHDGPFYIHCHHGKHRGPAAAAIACQVIGTFDRQQAVQFLKRAGTNPLYTGLYRDVEQFTLPASDVVLPELVSHAEVEELAAHMAKIDRFFDRVSGADSVQPEDVLLLLESFREAARNLTNHEMNLEMRKSIDLCEELHESVGLQAKKRHKLLGQLKLKCVQCHRRFRNWTDLSEI